MTVWRTEKEVNSSYSCHSSPPTKRSSRSPVLPFRGTPLKSYELLIKTHAGRGVKIQSSVMRTHGDGLCVICSQLKISQTSCLLPDPLLNLCRKILSFRLL